MHCKVLPVVRAVLESRPPLLNRGSVLMACVSGGADSVALLLALRELQKADGFSLCAVHVDHGLRGESSKEDRAFVSALCRELGVPLRVFEADVKHSLLKKPGGVEARAREMRYACFQAAFAEAGASALLTAHHRDDQAETVLMRLMRGAGGAGLSGIREESRRMGMRILRPFLSLPKKVLEDALREQACPWREDATNQEADPLRNKLRLNILPQLEAYCPGSGESISRAARLFSLEEDYWEGEIARLMAAPGVFYPGWRCLSLSALSPLHPAVRNRVIRAFWDASGPGGLAQRGLTLEQTEGAAGLVNAPAGSSLNLPGGFLAFRGYRCLHLCGPGPACPAESRALSPDESVPFGENWFRWRKALSGETGDGKTAQAMPASLLARVRVRTRRPGDWITPFGAAGRQSLQDYLVNRKIDRPFRGRLPLLAVESQILWVPGVGAGAPCALGEGEGPGALITLSGPAPWTLPAAKA